jgi:hypothetical protein
LLLLHTRRSPRSRLRNVLPPEPLRLGPWWLRCRALYDHVGSSYHLVRHLRALELSRVLARLQARRHCRASQNEPNPASNPPSGWIPATASFDGCCGRVTFWCYLRRTVLYHEQHLVQQSVLHVRLPVSLLRPHDHHQRGCHRADDLLPALRGELPLAVEEFLHGGRKRSVCVCELSALLDQGYQLVELDEWGCISGVQCAFEWPDVCADR